MILIEIQRKHFKLIEFGARYKNDSFVNLVARAAMPMMGKKRRSDGVNNYDLHNCPSNCTLLKMNEIGVYCRELYKVCVTVLTSPELAVRAPNSFCLLLLLRHNMILVTSTYKIYKNVIL